jgi:hypothetical protein
VSQAICLNNSLRQVGMPTLTIITNAPAEVAARLDRMTLEHRPAPMMLSATIELPKDTPFYAAHFKPDLMDPVARALPADTMLLSKSSRVSGSAGIHAGTAASSCWRCPTHCAGWCRELALLTRDMSVKLTGWGITVTRRVSRRH